MITLPCGIVKDLLPLYADHLCGEESRQSVEAHLKSCPACKAIYENMTADVSVPPSAPMPHEEEKKLFCTVRRRILSGSLLIAVLLICCFANIGDAWFGGPASPFSFAATLLFCAVFTILPLLTRKDPVCIRFFFAGSAVLSASALFAVLCRLTTSAGFLSAFLGMPVGMLFYGFRIVCDWTPTYLLAAVISLVWLGMSSVFLYRYKHKNAGKKEKTPESSRR